MPRRRARRAARCYLFHADYRGEKASVELSPSGEVRQAYGPHNCYNKAAQWATQLLAQWGRGLRGENGIQELNHNI